MIRKEIEMKLDFRDTKYWDRMTPEERENYVYLIRKFDQAWDEVEFAIGGKYFGEGSILLLAEIASRATDDLMEFERTLLVKYWKTNSPGGTVVQ